MNTTYTEKESSKKKYLVPLVVIMLCLVAFTGAAYAYSTSVKGNGDISGNYTALDMYQASTEEGNETKYTAVADLEFTSNKFTVTTARNNSVTESEKPYVATVVEGTLEYHTILHVNTTTDTTEFFLATPDAKYTPPEATDGAIPGTITIGEVTVTSVKEYGTSSEATYADGYYTLNSTKYYEITFTVAIEAGEYGTYGSLDDLKNSIALFDSPNTKELLVTFTAYGTKPVATQTDEESDSPGN